MKRAGISGASSGVGAPAQDSVALARRVGDGDKQALQDLKAAASKDGQAALALGRLYANRKSMPPAIHRALSRSTTAKTAYKKNWGQLAAEASTPGPSTDGVALERRSKSAGDAIEKPRTGIRSRLGKALKGPGLHVPNIRSGARGLLSRASKLGAPNRGAPPNLKTKPRARTDKTRSSEKFTRIKGRRGGNYQLLNRVTKEEAQELGIDLKGRKPDKDGTYKLVLGRGGYGAVRYARDQKGALCAVKKIPDDKIDKCLDEIKLAASLGQSPHVITGTDYVVTQGKDGGRKLYLFQPLMEQDLAKAYDLGGATKPAPLTQSTIQARLNAVRQDARGACAGLLHMHKKNTAHRDIKPENIMRRKDDGETGLIDLGLARAGALKAVPSSDVNGTEMFFSPQMIRCRDAPLASRQYAQRQGLLEEKRKTGGDTTAIEKGIQRDFPAGPPPPADSVTYDARAADVHAMGVTLHLMLTGEFPHNKPTFGGEEAQDGKGAPSVKILEMRDATGDVAEGSLAHLVAQMLHPDDAQKPSMDEVLNHPFFTSEYAFQPDDLKMFGGG